MSEYVEVPLSRGKVAKIDAEDLARVNKYKWSYHTLGYAFRSFKKHEGKGRGAQYLHRFIMNEPPCLVDHINRDPLDNRRANLRHADKSLNAYNSKLPSDNTSGAKGIHWDKSRKKWMVRLAKQHLGRYDSFEQALAIRRAAEIFNNVS